MSETPEQPPIDDVEDADPALVDETPASDPASDAGDESPEIAALRAQADRADELADRLKRVEAEFVNESKRLRRMAENDKKYAIEKVVVDLLPLVDALHTAISNLGDTAEDDPVRAGLDLVGKQLLETLSRHGVEPIVADGQVFDPNRHEALFTIPRDDVDPQTVVEVLRPGFTLHERVVRPAEVAVSVAAPPPPPADAAPGEDA